MIKAYDKGRAIGIIDFSQSFTSVVDAAAILGTVHDKTWSEYDDRMFRRWCEEFLVWLTESEFGVEEVSVPPLEELIPVADPLS